MPSPLRARTFRRRVLRPAEGVFLLHPRVLQRLVRRDLGDDSPNLTIPSLGYYLMPREVLLIGLEEENPDALAVIEGLKTRILEERQHESVEALAHNLAATWKLDSRSTQVLEYLGERLLDEPAPARFSSPYSRLLHDLERVFLEWQTEYYRLQTVVWLWNGGRRQRFRASGLC